MHLLRDSFRYASKKDWPALAKDLKPVYTAPTEAAGLDRFSDVAAVWEKKYPAIIRLWENAWSDRRPALGDRRRGGPSRVLCVSTHRPATVQPEAPSDDTENLPPAESHG